MPVHHDVDQVSAALVSFISSELLDSDATPDPDQSLLESGAINSYGLMVVITHIEDEYGVAFDARVDLTTLDTVGAMARWIVDSSADGN